MPSIEDMLIRLDATTEGLRRELKRGEQQIDRFEKRTNNKLTKIDGRFASLGRTILTRLVPALAATASTRSIFNNVQKIELVDARLRRLTESAEDYNRTQQYLSSTADRLGIDLFTLGDAYARLLTLQNAGVIDRGQVNDIAEGISNAARALGASNGQIENVLYGLGQALTQGTVQAQELNQVIEPLPGLLQALDKASGQSAGGFRRLVKEGKITSEVFADVLVKALEDYEGAAESMSGTTVASFTRLGNSWKQLSRTVAESALTDSLVSTTDWLARLVSAFDGAVKGQLAFAEAGGVVEKITVGVTASIALAWNTVMRAIVSTAGATLEVLNGFLSASRSVIRKIPGLDERVSQYTGLEKAIASIDAKEREYFENSVKRFRQLDVTAKHKKQIDDLRGSLEELNEVVSNPLSRGSGASVKKDGAEEVSASSKSSNPIDNIIKKYEDLGDAQDKVRGKQEALNQSSIDFANSVSNAFEDAILHGKGFKDILGGILQDLAGSVLRENVTGQVGSFFSTAIANILPFANGGIMTSSGSVPLRRYATGGVASSPQLAMFGEGTRPEAYVPLPDGRTIPVTVSGGGGNGGPVVQQTISIDARGADPSVLPKFDLFKEEIKRETMEAVAARVNRGGQYSKTMGRRS